MSEICLETEVVEAQRHYLKPDLVDQANSCKLSTQGGQMSCLFCTVSSCIARHVTTLPAKHAKPYMRYLIEYSIRYGLCANQSENMTAGST
jgi:hypothetical protein